MNSVERVRQLCKERKIPVYRLEKDLGYANGYINQLRKGVFPADRLLEIANYFSVSVDFLMTGVETEKAPALTEKDRRDVAKDVYQIMESLESSGELMFDGVPMTEESKAAKAAEVLDKFSDDIHPKFTPSEKKEGVS